MDVLITGAAGMLGTDLLATVPPGVEVVGVDVADGDLTDPAVAEAVVARHAPRVIIHCAAWTDVEGCTRDPARALQFNSCMTSNLAAACRAHHVRLLAISTDYVFAGDLERPYVEDDEPKPLNAYGVSKLGGERAAASVEDHLIVRTQWLYGAAGKNFVATIVRAARVHDTLRVVADEWGSPTYTRDLAAGLWQVASSDVRGILHLTNSGICTWHELASEAIAAAGLQVEIRPISSSEWNSPTVRPRYSPLENRRWCELGHEPLRPWQEAVREYVASELLDKETQT